MADKLSLPTTVSLKPEVVNAYVRDRVWKNPITLLVPIIGIGAGGLSWAFLLYFEWWMLAMGATGVAVGLGNYFLNNTEGRRDRLKSDYLRELGEQYEAQAEELTAWLRQEFAKLDHEQGQTLTDRLTVNLEKLDTVLSHKFPRDSGSYQHFHTAAEKLAVQVLNRLKDTVTQIEANRLIDADRARSLAERTSGEEKQAHERKLQLLAEGEEEVKNLLGSAEIAVVGITELTHNVAAISATDGGVELAKFLADVDSLARKANFYKDEQAII